MRFSLQAALAALSVVSASVLLTPQLARADVIFVDLNLSETEVQTARRAAAARGENLLVIPDLPAKVRAEATQLKRKRDRVKAKAHSFDGKLNTLRDELSSASRLTPERKKQLEAQIKVVADQQAPFNEEAKSLTSQMNQMLVPHGFGSDEIRQTNVADAIEKATAAIQARGRELSALIISGHHVSSFYGDVGRVTAHQVQTALRAVPGAAEGIRAVYLLGCYTTTRDLVKQWKANLPSLNVIMGYDGRGPSEDKAVAHDYLFGIMVREKKLADEKDARQVLQTFRGIPNIAFATAAMCVGDHYVTPQRVEQIKVDASACSPERIKNLREGKKDFDSYFLAESGRYDVPSDTGNSVLRQYYNELRKMSDCPEAKPHATDFSVIATLIYFKNVMSNFNLMFRSEIEAAQAALGERLPDLSNRQTTRKAVLEASAKLNEAAQAADAPTAVKTLARHYERGLADLSCIPDTWTEAASRMGELIQADMSCMDAP